MKKFVGKHVIFFSYLSILCLPSIVLAADGGLASFGAFSSNGFAGGIFIDVICDIYDLMGGDLGALLTTASLFVAICAAAIGGMGMVRSSIVVAVASFSLSTGVSIYFGKFSCEGNNGGNGADKSAIIQTIPNESLTTENHDFLDFNP